MLIIGIPLAAVLLISACLLTPVSNRGLRFAFGSALVALIACAFLLVLSVLLVGASGGVPEERADWALAVIALLGGGALYYGIRVIGMAIRR